ncbi:hypothetical protein FLL45_13945 [Aliikangiella marina]|uniref:Glutamine amidotransferase domain-containing protein n=1 Tax=Aliikangiella marina TaxID=1712262 RepID=A0A545T9R7_9GAMM|nr:gamma-glutamyl-gamma-aminobutyrate hydrolase family protein [Aliikangiella marina]TQV73960.1 hypothetical protein FLL45_13945 [Aliikangiella marina]
MKLVVIDCSSSKVPEIIKILEKLDCQVKCINFEYANNHEFSQFDAMVISGGPRLFTDQGQIEALTHCFEFINHVSCPILGICLGHQALGLASDAEVYRDTERRQSEIIDVTHRHPLVKQMGESFEMSTDHCEGITLPADYQLIAKSNFYPVEVMANDKLKRFGVQFHPEVSGTAGEQIFKNFLQLVNA